ncbi:Farnesyl pyrophosphate synthase [Folsomia candida]|uniref:Farnesyl pyrophosphate synthase n=1 Tax=Folsomia candida TaxID=158441 RepID=A0A226F2D4_FOLCA|nr:Farnesyl pyrophosphate synthase [Folsomia candida]
MAFRRKSMTIAEEDAFVLTFEELIDEIETLPEYQDDMQESLAMLRRAVCYNVPGGKQIRGRGVVAAYRALVDEPNYDTIKETYILGWCIEIFQTCFLVINDLIENSENRRGKLCWYLLDNIGDIAISDAHLMSGVVNIVLDRYFYDKPYYPDLIKLFHNIHLTTCLGLCMDTQSSKTGGSEGYSMERYSKIVKYKTGYNSFFLPVSCSMILANKTNEDDYKEIEELVLEMGLLFQAQDDFLDCFGDPRLTGRFGTDIAENKYSWLIVKAFEKANSEQKELLLANYGLGKQSSVKNERTVLNIYKDLGLLHDYRKFEDATYASICDRIGKLGNRIPTSIFAETAEIIYRRNK